MSMTQTEFDPITGTGGSLDTYGKYAEASRLAHEATDLSALPEILETVAAPTVTISLEEYQAQQECIAALRNLKSTGLAMPALVRLDNALAHLDRVNRAEAAVVSPA